MKILIEEYPYPESELLNVFGNLENLREMEMVSSNHFWKTKAVGYFYSKQCSDCVFLLPKVIIEAVPTTSAEIYNLDVNDIEKEIDRVNNAVTKREVTEKVFGKFSPVEIIDFDKFAILHKDDIDEQEISQFLFGFSVWVYRAINVYHHTHRDEIICKSKQWSQVNTSGERTNSSIIDIILSFAKFNRENKNFLLFCYREMQRGFNKINWGKTVSHKIPLIDGDDIIYMNLYNKKKEINYEEELLVIYYSILNYINETYGFDSYVNKNFALLKNDEFQNYLSGFGITRLRQIKYKYFSDKMLKLWNLCYTFFDMSTVITTTNHFEDYLFVHKFDRIFESIIDELIGDEASSKNFKSFGDGKELDHIYNYESLVNNEDIYYIGDSKYYKIGHNVEETSNSAFKQYTYAKNVIQKNLNLFNDEKRTAEQKKLQGMIVYIDDLTDGYNVTPNFFISAEIDKGRSYDKVNLKHREERDMQQIHFPNRLFDRDTLWVSHYDINFLYVLALYARDNSSEIDTFKKDVRTSFRDEVIKMLQNKYDFKILRTKDGRNIEDCMDKHFRKIIGKVFCPDKNESNILILALDKDKSFKETNKNLINTLSSDFIIYDNYQLGTDIHVKTK